LKCYELQGPSGINGLTPRAHPVARRACPQAATLNYPDLLARVRSFRCASLRRRGPDRNRRLRCSRVCCGGPIRRLLRCATIPPGLRVAAFCDPKPAFQENTPEFNGWTVVDFKTDREIEKAGNQYRAQVAACVDAVAYCNQIVDARLPAHRVNSPELPFGPTY
jgi:hypothetical protein